MEAGEINSKFCLTLRASKTREAVRDVENGFAASAGELDLGGINAVGWNSSVVVAGRVHHQLRGKHLRQLAGRANKLGKSRANRQYHSTTGATNLTATRRWREKRRRWGNRWWWWLPHFSSPRLSPSSALPVVLQLSDLLILLILLILWEGGRGIGLTVCLSVCLSNTLLLLLVDQLSFSPSTSISNEQEEEEEGGGDSIDSTS